MFLVQRRVELTSTASGDDRDKAIDSEDLICIKCRGHFLVQWQWCLVVRWKVESRLILSQTKSSWLCMGSPFIHIVDQEINIAVPSFSTPRS